MLHVSLFDKNTLSENVSKVIYLFEFKVKINKIIKTLTKLS